MSGKYHAGFDFIVKNETQAIGSSSWGPWTPIKRGEGLSAFTKATSSGSATLAVDFQISPFPIEGFNDGTTAYVVGDLATTVSTDATATLTTTVHIMPAEVNQPFLAYRARLTVAVANCTLAWLAVVRSVN